MRETAMLRPESVTSVSSLLQNFPAPAGSLLDTFSWDYDHERFFLLPGEDITGFGRALSSSAILHLHGALDTSIRELGEGQVVVLIDTFLPDVAIARTMSQVVRSWASVEPKGHVVPLQFNVLKTNVSQEILHFCFRQGILKYLPTAIDLLGKCFPSIEDVHLEEEQDPETGEEWLTLNFTVRAQINEVLDKYDKYTYEWISLVPWPERHKIRLSYNII